MVIWKYPLQFMDVQAVEMPRYSTPLTVQMQDGVPTLWAMVHEKEAKVTRYIAIFGTGTPITLNVTCFSGPLYLGTIQHNGLVWHFFEAQVSA